MSNIVKDINIKSQTYYFFDDIINKKDFDLNNIKMDKKSYIIFLIMTLHMQLSKIQNA